ncbi:uncharacterized protein si:dkeyp-117h8.4 [Tachysurus vachellii]|uniref:uncharacterized protein si:dkeyp-117h8.4 n=1 Tax=Tachysurus vachellii TaxID=175792 RepID=UPI00296AF481|nr:uncharacterized protein si:dkeyp-117h8.4 [Tachysurus vachellii]
MALLNQEILDQLKKNDETFRNTMERIFQKYSNLDDPGPEVCLKKMTITSEKGSVPLHSITGEKEMQHLKNQLKKQPLQVSDCSQQEHTLLDQNMTSSLSSCQMDETVVNIDCSNQMENSTSSQLCGSEASHLFVNSTSSSRSCLWDESAQPEEEDQDLERTLNSNGSTLLDVYPSMLNQIGKAYRRQHVNNTASAVLRRYHRRRWQSSQAQQHSHGFSKTHNHTLNRTRECLLAAPKPARDNITNHQKSTFKYQGSSPHKSKVDFSSLKGIKGTSHESTACFYSPRKDDAEKTTGVENRSARWTGQCSNSKSPHHRPVRVLDLSTPPSPGSSSPGCPSPDLNQTFIVEPVSLSRSPRVPAPSVSSATWSPLKMARMLSLANQRCNSVNPSPSYHYSGRRRDHVRSPAASPHRAISASLSQIRSPLKTKISDQQTSFSYFKQASPMIHTSEVFRSPYQGQRYPPSPHQETPTKKLKHQPSFSSHFSPSSFVSRIPSRQIDAEFMNLYHHFICRSTNPTSSCPLCKRRSGVQNPAFSSNRMSALSLTPVRSRFKKRPREPEVVESLRFKRFRESCSPRRTSQFWPKQQQEENTDVNSAMEDPNEDQYTWNRALLLQCPSPGFLRTIRQSGSESNRRRPGSRQDLQTRYSPSWRESLRCGAGEGGNFEMSEGTRSPVRAWDRSDVSVSPRLSRRRLLYSHFQ